MFNKIVTIVSLTLLSTTLSFAEMDHSKMNHDSMAKDSTMMMDSTSHAQTTCPVMEGNPINKDLYVDVEGKRIYVCCGYCIKQVKKDPKKYIAQLKAEGVVLEDAPK